MRALIISDIHANLTALRTVLENAESIDQVWCIGDIVGYGPDPNECIELLRTIPKLVCVMGNHDAAVCGHIALEAFNPEASLSIQWTRSVLKNSNMKWLNLLPEKIDLETATLAHGSPRNPIWEYILDAYTAALCFEHFATDICFVGHTHLPMTYRYISAQQSARGTIIPNGLPSQLSGRMIVNPGSVGQPRDRDPRASFGIYDTTSREWAARRVAYDISEVQTRIMNTKLPERHALRLTDGW